ncbi:MAG: catalase family peroxidase [Solirubrobacterales bacterium]
MAGGDLYEQIVEAANALYGTHDGSRALHAKGTWCAGTFMATPEAAELCRAAHFQGKPTPAVIRFSNASGDPNSDDWQRDSRGTAVRMRPPGGDEADILAVTTPAFVLRTPEEFLEFMRLRMPNPETGQPDWEKLGAFLGEHPESQPAVQATLNAEPPASFATLVFQSPHTFKLLAADGSPTWVRYRWRPEAGEASITDDEAKSRGGDYLRSELAERLADGPAAFDLKLQIPTEGDPIDDPTAVWPEDRERVDAGRLEITDIIDDPEGDDHIEVFDPTRTGDGIELSDDRILHARARAYSVSAYRRLGVEVDNPSTPPVH